MSAATTKTPAKAAKPAAKGKSSTLKSTGHDYQTALTSLPEALRTETLRLSQAIDQLKEDDIRKRYELGSRLLAIRDDKTGQYGDDPLTKIADVMPLSKDGLRPMIVLAESYTDKELTSLLELRHPVTTERLTWTHIISLTRVKDKAKAMRLAEQTVAEGWTSRDLHRKIIQAHGGKRSQGGRKVKKPTTFRDGLTDVCVRSAAWVNAADTVWLTAEGLSSLYEAQASVPGYRPDQSTEDQLSATADQLVVMQLKLAGLIQAVTALKNRVGAARTARATA